jgi:3-phenylpropionate/trans-cinnamate dioxygenase ferredoxin reductase subunit
MAGIDETFPGSVPHNITHFMGMDFAGIGDTCEYDKVEEFSDAKKFMQFFWKEGLLTGANFVDTHAEIGIMKGVLIKGLLEHGLASGSPLPVVQDLLVRKILTEVRQT